jgi:AraC-like DNA-binding protein
MARITVVREGAVAFAHAEIPPSLRGVVEGAWASEGRLDRRVERLLPSATVDLVANLGPPMGVDPGFGTDRVLRGCISGLLQGPAILRHPAFHRAVGFRLRPRGARILLDRPIADLADRFVDLEDVVGDAARALEDRCHDARTLEEVLERALGWAQARVRTARRWIDPLVATVVAAIEEHDGATRIGALRHASGLGEARFVARFRAEVGLAPKRYARLVRFRAALDRLRPDLPLSALAADLGYADQAHMNGDFRELGGTTPREVLAARWSSGLTLAE